MSSYTWDFLATNPSCFWCQRPIVPPLVLTREHLVPVSQGGGNMPHNIVAACKDCNRYRAAIKLDDWMWAIEWARGAGIPANHVSPVARYLCKSELKGFKVADRYKVALLDFLIANGSDT